MGVFGYDLTDPGLFDNGFPHRIFTGIRRDRPVAWHFPPDNAPDIPGFWSVSTYEATATVLELLADVPHAPSVVDDAIGVAVLELARRPDLWAGLRSGELPLTTAAAELARWISPTTSIRFDAVEALTLGRETISPGETVVCWLASANRDDAVFGRTAMELDLRRWPNPHLAFAGRPALADEFASRLDELVRSTSALHLRGEPEWERSTWRTALASLPVELLSA